MPYAGLALERVGESVREVDGIAQTQAAVLTWAGHRRKKRLQICNELERDRQRAERELVENVLELLFLLGLIDERHRPQTQDESVNGLLMSMMDSSRGAK